MTGDVVVGEGLDDGRVRDVRAHDNGTMQVAVYGLPLYTFSGDTAPGDTNGQGVGDIWYVVGANGKQDRRRLAAADRVDQRAEFERSATSSGVEGVDGPAQPRVDVLDRDCATPTPG